MRSFGVGILAGLLLTFGGIATAFLGVYVIWPNHLPAPAISNYPMIDEKLRFIRERPDIDPHVLAVGSSIAWRQISGSAFEKVSGGKTRFLNGGVVHLKIHQTRELAKFYLAHYRNVRTLLLLTSLNDFEDCTTEPIELMNRAAATGYAFERHPAAFYYMRYFAPQRYVKSGLELPERTKPLSGDLHIDEYGSGLIMLPEGTDLGLRYREKETDLACVDSLIRLSADMAERDMRMMIVFTPVHSEYWRRYGTELRNMTRIIDEVSRGVAKHPTAVIDLHRDGRFAEADFYDAYHVEAAAAHRLSVLIADELRQFERGDDSREPVRPVATSN